MIDEQAKKSLKDKVYVILNNKQPAQAIIELFQLEATLSSQLKIHVRQPILFVFENQHDWQNVLKCLRQWKGLQRWIRSFYQRMKRRLNQTPDSNVPDHQMMAELNKLINRHLVQYEKRKPLIVGVEKYFKKDEPNDGKSSVKSVKSVNSLQSVRSNPMNSSIQTAQTTVPSQSVTQVQPLKPTQSLQNISSTNAVQRKTQALKPEQPKISRMTEHVGSERSNSKSQSSKQGIKPLNMIKKPMLNILRKEQNSNTNSQPVGKHPKRLTFGISDELRGNLKLKKLGADIGKKVQVIQVKPPSKKQEQKPNNQNLNVDNKTSQQAIEVQNKPEQQQKPNVFERKEQVPVRVNPIFVTEKKQIPPNQNQQNQQIQQRSVSRSVTPHKPLIERKKIVLKKPNDFKPHVSNNDDDFDFDEKPNHVQSFNKEDVIFYSERKLPSQPIRAANRQEQELRRQIQNANTQPLNNMKQNPEKEIIMVQKQQPISKTDVKIQQKKGPAQQAQKNNPQVIHPSMIRREDQLYSDYEVSLMGFNPREDNNDVDIYKIISKLNFNVTEEHNQKLQKELEDIKKRKAERTRRYKL